MKNEIAQAEVREMTVGQFKDLCALAAQAIPVDMTFEVANDVLGHKTSFINHVRAYFPKPSDITNPVGQWEDFYQKVFGTKTDLSRVRIPGRTMEQSKEFTRLIIVMSGLTQNQVYDACAKHFKCWRYADDLDKAIPTNERDPKNGAYAIWVRDTVEADEVNKNKSADMIRSERLRTETNLERMLHGLKYFLESGKHLDIKNVTLSSGSRDSGGIVPYANWGGSRFRVNGYGTGYRYDGLRSREVVS